MSLPKEWSGPPYFPRGRARRNPAAWPMARPSSMLFRMHGHRCPRASRARALSPATGPRRGNSSSTVWAVRDDHWTTARPRQQEAHWPARHALPIRKQRPSGNIRRCAGHDGRPQGAGRDRLEAELMPLVRLGRVAGSAHRFPLRRPRRGIRVSTPRAGGSNWILMEFDAHAIKPHGHSHSSRIQSDSTVSMLPR